MTTTPDQHGNLIAREGCDRCACGCKYWEKDRCVDCGGAPVVRILSDTDLDYTRRFVEMTVRVEEINETRAVLGLAPLYRSAYRHFGDGVLSVTVFADSGKVLLTMTSGYGDAAPTEQWFL